MSKKRLDGEKQENGSSRKRRRFLKGGLFAGITALAAPLSLTPFAPEAMAQSTAQGMPEIVQIQGAKAQRLIKRVKASSNYHTFEQQVKQVGNGLSVQEQKATAFRIKTTKSNILMVTIPVSGGVECSYYTTVFSAASGILSEQSGLFEWTADKHIHGVLQYYGQGTIDAVFTTDGDLVEGTALSPAGKQSLNDIALSGSAIESSANIPCGWGCFIPCLQSQGAPAFVIGLARRLCTVLCAIGWVANPFCDACLTVTLIGLIGAYSWMVFYCIGYCPC